MKNGSTKMTWNSPFQSLQPNTNQNTFDYINDTTQVSLNGDFNTHEDDGIDPDVSLNTLLNCDSLLNGPLIQQAAPQVPITDIPALDSLFSELNSDLNFDQNHREGVGKSEPVNLDDIERILLPQTTRRNSN